MSGGETPIDPCAEADLPASRLSRPGVRHALFALGCVCVVLGLIGVVVPVMPTTIFMIIALWAFARSSERLHRWLYTHPRFGPGLRAWDRDRVIPVRAKLLAVTLMAVSWVILAVATNGNGWTLGGVGAVLAVVAAYILSRPSAAPD